MLVKKIDNILNEIKTLELDSVFIGLMVFGIPFTLKIGNILLLISFAYAIFKLVKYQRRHLKIRIHLILIFPIVFFLILILSALFSKDVVKGFVQVEKNLLLLVIPFTIAVLQRNRVCDQRFLLGIFTFSTFLSSLILLIVGIIRFIKASNFDLLFFHEYGAFFDLHPVYISICVSISIFFITEELFIAKRVVVGRHLFLILFFYLILILCASKAVILCFLLLHFAHLYIRFKRIFKFLLLSIFTFFILLIISTKNLVRLKEGFHFDLVEFNPTDEIENARIFLSDDKMEISDLELRFIMLKIGLYHLWKEGKVFFGYGIGDVQDYIDYHYMIYNLAPGWYEGYNLHNQYLQMLVSFGIFVLLFFVYYLALSVRVAIRSENPIFLLFLLLMLFVFLGEVILSRNKGIIIFYFFNTLFFLNAINENRNIRN